MSRWRFWTPPGRDGAEQQPGESREDWKLRTFALHYGAGLLKIEEMLAKREI